ncbi:hypothetical protein BDV12DRAFT_202689 [Aspergillus spectabilis]
MESLNIGKTATVAQSTLYALIWVEFAVCTAVIALRGYSQLFIVRRPCVDDLVMLGAYILQGIASALCTASTYWGLGSDLATMLLNRESVNNTLKYAMISMPFGVLGPMLGRISFILFLNVTVLTVHHLRRKCLWGLIVLQVITNIIPIVLQFTMCRPISALWDPLLLQRDCGSALVVQKYGFFQGAFNAFTDLVLIVIGIVVIIHLKLHRRTKIALSVILSLSSLAMIAAILKTIQLQLMASSSFSYAYATWTIWYLTEGTVIIITVSIPRLRPMIILRRKSKNNARSKSTYNNAFSNETLSRGRRSQRQHRFGSGYEEDRSLEGRGPTVKYPKSTKIRTRWPGLDDDMCSDSRELIMLESDLSASHSMQKFIHS